MMKTALLAISLLAILGIGVVGYENYTAERFDFDVTIYPPEQIVIAGEKVSFKICVTFLGELADEQQVEISFVAPSPDTMSKYFPPRGPPPEPIQGLALYGAAETNSTFTLELWVGRETPSGVYRILIYVTVDGKTRSATLILIVQGENGFDYSTKKGK